jgi:hypothetical protein
MAPCHDCFDRHADPPPHVQARLLEHMCRHAEPYCQLLGEHTANPRVSELLTLLAGGANLASFFSKPGATLGYLRLLTCLAGQLGGSLAGNGVTGGSPTGNGVTGGGLPALTEVQARLLADMLTCMVDAVASLELDARQQAAQQLAGSERSGRLPPAKLAEQVEARVR